MYLLTNEGGEWKKGLGPAISKTIQCTVNLNKEIGLALVYDDRTFKDITKHWARNETEVLYTKGVVNGYPNGEFKPEQTVTRAEFIKMAMLLRKLEVDYTTYPIEREYNVTDIARHWGKDYILRALDQRIIKGFEGKISPDSLITREEMVIIATRVLGADGLIDGEWDNRNFKDKDKINSWAKNNFITAYNIGLIKGINDSELDPQGKVTRGQASSVLFRILLMLEK
jgi:hypothetical protein